MLKNIYPLFKIGNVLDKQALDLLRDNPMELLNLLFIDYFDGIINGFELKVNVNKESIEIAPGILKYKDKIFWLDKNVEIKIPAEEDQYIIKIRLEIEIKENKRYIRKGEILCDKNMNLEENEMELARFIKRIGADLQNNYETFRDHKREHNLLEIINLKFSSKHSEGTLHPKILQNWGKDAIEREDLDAYDINFCMNCLNNDRIERDVIIAYINRKLEKNKKEYSNYDLFYDLLKILENLGLNRNLKEKKFVMPEKIIID